MSQVEFNFSAATQATNEGIQRAADNANRVHDNWTDKAYDYFKEFVKTRRKGERFMTEDVRKDAHTVVPIPPTAKAWGAVIRRAVHDGIIIKVGYNQVKNIKAHKTPASVWTRA
jgi:hypothetical protein